MPKILFRKSAVWTSLVALIVATFVAVPNATATGRFNGEGRATLGTSTPGAATSFDIDLVKVQTTATIKSFRFQICTSPLQSVACTLPAGAVWGGTITNQAKGGTTFPNLYSGTPSGSDFLMTNATGNLLSQFDVIHFSFVTSYNPSAPAGTFYFRVTSCTDTTCDVSSPNYTNNVDFGAMAASTASNVTVNASVQETLTFCVGVTVSGSCATVTGSTVTLAPNTLATTAPSTGTAMMAASTNASGGYSITYNATSFSNPSANTITAAPTGGAAASSGTEQFGFTLRRPTSGSLNALGTDPSGGTGTVASPYNAVDSTIAYNTAGATAVASAPAAAALTTFTILFAANVSATTRPGTYTATQTYIATANF